jgi:hypothetical protein
MAKDKATIMQEVFENQPSWMDKTPGSANYGLVDALATEEALVSQNTDSLSNAVFIDTAQGQELDDLARMFNLVRKPAESDATFRGRIKSYWTGFTGGGTESSLKMSLASALGVPESSILLTQSESRTEQHYYTSTIELYPLYQKTAVPASIVLTGTAGGFPYNFVQGVDFQVVNNQIDWSLAGTNPDNATVFTVTYTYVPDLKIAIQTPIAQPEDIDLVRLVEEQNKAAGVLIENTFDFTGSPTTENVLVSDSVTITSTGANGFFIIELSLIEGGDVTT